MLNKYAMMIMLSVESAPAAAASVIVYLAGSAAEAAVVQA